MTYLEHAYRTVLETGEPHTPVHEAVPRAKSRAARFVHVRDLIVDVEVRSDTRPNPG